MKKILICQVFLFCVNIHGTTLSAHDTSPVFEDGRLNFLTATTAWSLGAYGWIMPTAWEMETRPAVGYYLLSSGLSFYVPFLATSKKQISMGQAKMTEYGAFRSVPQGYLVARLFYGSNENYDTFAYSGLTLSLVQMVAGYRLAETHKLTAAQAETWKFYADYALVTGALAGYAASTDNPIFMGGLGLAANAIGLVYGLNQAQTSQRSTGDINIMYLTTFLGGYTLYATSEAIFNNSSMDWAIAGAGAIGTTMGMFFGENLTQNVKFTDLQSQLLAYSTVGGWLMGVGAAYTFFGTYTDEPSAYRISTVIGSMIGFGSMYYYLSDDLVSGKTTAANRRVAFNYNPIALASHYFNPGDKKLPGNFFNLKVRLD